MCSVSLLCSETTNNEGTLEKLRDTYQFSSLWLLFCWFFQKQIDKGYQPYSFFFFFLYVFLPPVKVEEYFIQRYVLLFHLCKGRKVVVNIKDQGILAERPGLLAENQSPLFIDFLACVFFLKMYSVELHDC